MPRNYSERSQSGYVPYFPRDCRHPPGKFEPVFLERVHPPSPKASKRFIYSDTLSKEVLLPHYSRLNAPHPSPHVCVVRNAPSMTSIRKTWSTTARTCAIQARARITRFASYRTLSALARPLCARPRPPALLSLTILAVERAPSTR